ncbi:MAG: hypothetical protein N3D75_03070 [Candidatus Aenigmarchaeota archaeon]|nr:hypothetical protein [Candidatus Aenigmarchaeota archaeon]
MSNELTIIIGIIIGVIVIALVLSALIMSSNQSKEKVKEFFENLKNTIITNSNYLLVINNFKENNKYWEY